MTPRILLTNDDGVYAPGIAAAYHALTEVGDVWMVAPERPRSAAGHAITLHKPLRLTPVRLQDGTVVHACSGTPTDCVSIGFDLVLEDVCDLVVSGINSGPNLGWDLSYSGTVAAAMEGAILNVPSMAISVTLDGDADGFDFGPAARLAALLGKRLLTEKLPPHTLLNVNVPAVSESELRGIEITHQGKREYVERIDGRVDPTGRPYYWLGGSIREDVPDPGSDVHAILANRVSVTPVHLDMTAYALLDKLKEWNL